MERGEMYKYTINPHNLPLWIERLKKLGINKPLYFHWKLYKLFHIYANEHEGIMCVIFFSDYSVNFISFHNSV